VLKNDLESGGWTPLSIRPARDNGEITKNYACNQSGVQPPHSKISRRSSLELSFSAACWLGLSPATAANELTGLFSVALIAAARKRRVTR
jgi:hypothetical protein